MRRAGRQSAAAEQIAAEAVIQVRNVLKCFGPLRAVDNLDLSIGRGEFLALLGPNGAGKTTLIEMIEGIQRPDAGEIRILGRTWKDSEKFLRTKMGIALQETRFVEKLTVLETLNTFASFFSRTKERSLEILSLVQLQEKKDARVVNLSGGQRQRLALGLALLNNPEILLLDEPTTGLDPHARRDIWTILEKLKQGGATMILTTHYMEEAEYLCDRIVIMDRGKILAQGTLTELISRSNGGDIIEFRAKEKVKPEIFKKIRGLIGCSFNEETAGWKLIVRAMTTALPEFINIAKKNRINMLDLECRRMTLDDLFISMTGRHLAE